MSGRRSHGEGGIRQRPDGRWEATIDLGVVDGKRRRKYLYGKTRREVARKLDDARGQVRGGGAPAPERLTVGVYLDTWLETVKKDAVGPRTYARNEEVIRLHLKPSLGHLKLKQLHGQDVLKLQKALRDRGLAPRTVLKVRSVLADALTDAKRQHLILNNPVEDVDPPRVEGDDSVEEEDEPRILDRSEARAFIEAVRGDRLEALYLVAMALGVRKGEALGLKWTDLDWDSGALRIRRQLQRIERGQGRRLLDTKTRAGRRNIYLPAFALATLQRHRERQDIERALAAGRWQDHGLIFPSTVGTPLEPRNLNRTWDALRRRLGLADLTLHGLRHSATSLYLALGVPPHVVQGIVGHADMRTTMQVYAHVTDDDRKSAARLLDAALISQN